jgi:polysaccharide biosynthesis transport protein
MDISQILSLAWRRRRLIGLVVVAVVFLSGAFAYSRPKEYDSTATIILTPTVRNGQPSVQGSDNISTLLSTYAAKATSSVVKNAAANILGRRLPGSVKAGTTAGSGILKITGHAEIPRDASETARVVAEAFIQSGGRDQNSIFSAELVNPPEVPTAPIAPRPPLIIAAGLVLGLLLGLGLAVVFEQWFRRVADVSDLTEVTELPVIGHVPRTRAVKQGESELVWDTPDAYAVQEAFRALRTNVQFMTDDERGVLQITSATPGEGKSTIAANLAVALGNVGIPVLLVDADLRRPRQHEIFNVPNERGLANLMTVHGSRVEPVATGYDNVWLLPSGPVPPNSTEMLSMRFGPALRELRKTDALIIIDTPPVLPVSDARLIATEVNRVLLVVAAGSAKPNTVRQVLERLSVAESHVLGIVLNYAGKEGRFGARRGYRDYYAADASKVAVPTGSASV